MRAMILGAGLGTRLRPLTFVRPKALVPVMGTTVLEFWLARLHTQGFQEVALNTYHLASRFRTMNSSPELPIPLRIFEEKTLLGTGGGIRNALECFKDEDFVVVNGDTVCDVDLRRILRKHLGSGEPVSLVLHDHPPFNNVAVQSGDSVVAFGEEARRLAQKDDDIQLLAFTGIHCLHPELLRSWKSGMPLDILSVYRDFIEKRQPIKAIVLTRPLWREMGTLEAYRALHVECGRWPEGILEPLPTGRSQWVHPSCEVEPETRFSGYVAVGRRCRIRRGAVLEDTILWDDVEIGEGSVLKNCIVTDRVSLRGDYADRVFTKGLG